MEGINFSLEPDPDDDKESPVEKKDKKDGKEKKPSIFEKSEDDDAKKQEETPVDKDEKKEQAREIPLEDLAEDEKQTVVEQYVEARGDEIKQELVEVIDDSADEAAVLANAALLENIQDKIDEEELITEELLDEAVAETVEELGLEAVVEDEPADETEDEMEDDPAAAHTVIVPPSRATPTPTSPPSPPVPPVTPPMPPADGGTGVPFYGATPPLQGTLHTLRTPNAAPKPTPDVLVVRDRRRERSNLLVGGIVGYMIGRRRGRIKTEKKLLPVQEKLEKEVVNLHHQIAEREEKIRRLAYENAESAPTIREKITERIERKQDVKRNQQARPEKLGKFAVLAERPDARTLQKPVEIMSIPELLTVAAGIKIEQSSVRRLHETNHLSDDGLRRIVRAYMRGEQHEKILLENLLSPEIYRGPDNKHPEVQDTAATALRQALQDQGSSNFALPSLNSTQPNEDVSFSPIQRTTRNNQTKTVVAGTVVVIAILLLVLLIVR